jgi:hypothetical protein
VEFSKKNILKKLDDSMDLKLNSQPKVSRKNRKKVLGTGKSKVKEYEKICGGGSGSVGFH